MIAINNKFCLIGTSSDAICWEGGAALNVARDLRCQCKDKVEYAQVGLVDGPGNESRDYCAAVLMLVALLRRHELVLVYDHSGVRALVVALMYAALLDARPPARTFGSHYRGWRHYADTLLGEGRGIAGRVHEAHVEAFEAMPFGMLSTFL